MTDDPRLRAAREALQAAFQTAYTEWQKEGGGLSHRSLFDRLTDAALASLPDPQPPREGAGELTAEQWKIIADQRDKVIDKIEWERDALRKAALGAWHDLRWYKANGTDHPQKADLTLERIEEVLRSAAPPASPDKPLTAELGFTLGSVPIKMPASPGSGRGLEQERKMITGFIRGLYIGGPTALEEHVLQRIERGDYPLAAVEQAAPEGESNAKALKEFAGERAKRAADLADALAQAQGALREAVMLIDGATPEAIRVHERDSFLAMPAVVAALAKENT